MKKLWLIAIVLAATTLWAQQGAESKPYPTEHNPPGARQGVGNFSQSTIQGCVVGSAGTSNYVLTDENNGEIYVLHGNDPLLKEQVGHEVVMTGVATPIRPSNEKGTLGYINPNAPSTRSTSAQGGRALNFQVMFIRPIAGQCRQQSESQKEALAASQAALGSVQSENQTATEPQIGYAAQSQTQNTLIGCVSGGVNLPLLVQQQAHRTYRLQGNTAEVKKDIGMLVKVTGRLLPGTGPSVSGATESAPAFQVQTVQNLGESCRVSAGLPALPVTGKSGGEGQAMNASTTSSAGQVTPGFETPAGQAQAAGPHTNLSAGGVHQPQNQTATQGAPPTWEQAAQNPAAAETIAQGAQQAELSNPQHQLGVNTQPSYAQNRNSQNQTELPGASQHISAPAGAQRKEDEQAAEHEQTHPTLVGCLTQGSRGFLLTEQKSGTRYRLNGPADELRDHVSHLVEVVGRPAKTEGGAAKAAAGRNEAVFDVMGVQDLAPTCGAEHQH